MKISRNWLSDYIVSNKTDDQLVDDFTKLGLECTFHKNNSIDPNVVVGEVVSCIKHPDADRLKVCEVNVSDDDLLTIVCGAPNVKKNILVPIAKVGSNLGEFEIKKTKIRGVVSQGMICSEKELGLSDEHEGIMILNGNIKKGQKLTDVLSIKEDTIFDFDLTPNRGDCFSHLGIARELSIIENKKNKLNSLKFSTSNFSTSKFVKVDIKNSNICKRYSCIIIKNIKVAKSPIWLKQKLESIGQKSINNVVDLANFIMFDLGQPLHVFDLDKIKGSKIDVRLASKNEKIITLDSETKELTNEDIVISDSKGPIAIAGVIGGLNSHVDESTKNILIESAIFNPISIRRTAKKHDCSTEASKRFEREINYKNVVYSMQKFVYLLQDISDCEVACDYIDEKIEEQQNREILFDVLKCNSFLGTLLKSKEIKSIFNSLSIDCSNGVNSFKCLIPSYRNDLYRDVDLYEEVARVYGYYKIPISESFNISLDSLINDESFIEDKIRLFLSSNDFNEHYSNSLNNKKENNHFSNGTSVMLSNPLNKDMSVLRNSLIPGILKSLSFNEKRKQDFLKYFEIGSIQYIDDEKNNVIEERKLSVVWMGDKVNLWKGSYYNDFFRMKGEIIEMLSKVGIETVVFNESNKDYASYSVEILHDKIIIGSLFKLNDSLKSKYKIKSDVYISEINLSNLIVATSKRKKFEMYSTYPAIKRDIALLLKKKYKNSDVENGILESGGDLLKSVKLFDYYSGDDIPSDSISLAYSLTFQANDRTLNDKEVESYMDKIMILLKKDYKIIQR